MHGVAPAMDVDPELKSTFGTPLGQHDHLSGRSVIRDKSVLEQIVQ